MSELFRNSYFYKLPNEVLIKILNDIDTLSLSHFCEIYQCDYFMKDKYVIQTVNLSKCYVLQDLSQVSKKIPFEHVTTLNVNGLYWIPPFKLRKFISRLKNLETLYAIQTSLSLTPSDTEMFSESKIKKLGVSMTRHDDEVGTHIIESVETLYIGTKQAKCLISLLILQTTFPRLTKLWVDVEESCGKETLLNCLNNEDKSKIFCQVNAPIPSIDFGLTTYYKNRRACQPYVMCCEKFEPCLENREEIELPDCWNTLLNELHCSKPYGPRDARRLYCTNSFRDVFFEELNFYHFGALCVDRCREAVKEILKSSCAKQLKKLCVMMCLLENENATQSVSIKDPNGFTRKRRGVENSTSSHSVEKIFRNFPDLRQLEIYFCHRNYSHYSAIQGYPLIALFHNLQSLILEVPVTVDGSFLSEVLKKCKRLEILKVTALAQHEKLNFNISGAVPNATALKDFRYENHRVQLDSLLQRLCLIRTKQIERIVIICKEIDKFSAGPLKEFLELNPQLIFLYFIIKECTENSLKMAQLTLNKYKKRHPSKVFLVKKADVGFPIPYVHFHEMVKCVNGVAGLNALEDFVSF